MSLRVAIFSMIALACATEMSVAATLASELSNTLLTHVK